MTRYSKDLSLGLRLSNDGYAQASVVSDEVTVLVERERKRRGRIQQVGGGIDNFNSDVKRVKVRDKSVSRAHQMS